MTLSNLVIPDGLQGRSGTQRPAQEGWVPALRFATAGMTLKENF